MKKLLEIRNMTVRYGARLAVDNVDLVVDAGKTLGLVGESGAGKSTILRAVAGLVPVESGSVRWKGVDTYAMDYQRLRHFQREVQCIFQDPGASLNPRRFVGDVVAEPLVRFRLVPPSRRAGLILDALEATGLGPEYYHRLPGSLSPGQQQRVAIARAIVANPECILADEAVSALDVSVQASVLNLLVELQQRLGFSMVFVSHDLAVVQYISDHIAVMRNGVILEHSTPDAFGQGQLLDPYVREMWEACPRPEVPA